MNFGRAFTKIFYREASKVVDQRMKDKRLERHLQELEAKYAEEQKQNEVIHQQKVKRLEHKIEITEDYLRNEVKVLELFERKKKTIKKWFYQNYWLKTISERRPANYSEIKMTDEQKRELLNKLKLKPKHYVPHGILNELTEDATLEFIIENTSVIKELRERQDKEGYNLYIANHGIRTSTTICFGLVIKDDAKQPF
ncbi:hypothetical protein [Bacillus sp. FJAT-29814]|uniref:hypothetical protein n=1 Tax=Bacillus sp. FJAT-29814 TaxID=1729688 RepID=UPI00082AF881|nr:hypothetical protein [Bacillus sp. FJAT-29814]